MSMFSRNPSPVSTINSLDPWLSSDRQPPPPPTLLGSPQSSAQSPSRFPCKLPSGFPFRALPKVPPQSSLKASAPWDPRRPPSPASLSGLPSGRPEGSAQGSYPRAPLRCPSQSSLTGPPSGPPQGSLGDPLRAPPGRLWERNSRKWQIFAHFH